MHATTIVAYTYQAEILCPTCTVRAYAGDEFTLVPGSWSTEQYLDFCAESIQLDREDERSFDSDDFPKVVFADCVMSWRDRADGPTQVENCYSCGEPLI